MVDHFLLLVDLNSKATLFIENILFVLLVHLATQAASTRQYQVSLRLLSILNGLVH